MKIIADESVEFGIIKLLRQKGYDVEAIIETNRGASDERVIEIANEKNALVLTEDKDFGELTYRLNIKHYGIILLRFSGFTNEEKAIIASNVFEKYFSEFLNSFTVITRHNIRIRKLD